MSDELVRRESFSVGDMQTMAFAIAKSNLFGIKTPEQALSLLLIAQAEGRHPALAALDYNIIQGKPSKTSKAIQRDFLASGGRIEWHRSDDEVCDATFSHPQGGTLRVKWDLERAKKAGLLGKANWDKYTAAMLRARCVSEGCDAVCPGMAGLYPPEVVQDFDEPRNVTPTKEIVNEKTGEISNVPAPSPSEDKAPSVSPSYNTDWDSRKAHLLMLLREMSHKNPMWNEEEHFKEITGKDTAKLKHIEMASTQAQMDRIEKAITTAEKWLADNYE